MRVNHQHETNNLASNSGLFGCALSAQNCAPISPEKNAKLHKREQQVSFSQPYYEGLSAVVVTRKGAYHTFADLKGKKVGLENGTTHQRYLQDKQQAITPVAYDSYLNAFTDLKNNRLEGVFGDVAAIGKWLKNNPDYAIMDERASDPDYYGKGLGIAVRKGNDALLQEINAALDKVKASPEYAQMQEKWFTQ